MVRYQQTGWNLLSNPRCGKYRCKNWNRELLDNPSLAHIHTYTSTELHVIPSCFHQTHNPDMIRTTVRTQLHSLCYISEVTLYLITFKGIQDGTLMPLHNFWKRLSKYHLRSPWVTSWCLTNHQQPTVSVFKNASFIMSLFNNNPTSKCHEGLRHINVSALVGWGSVHTHICTYVFVHISVTANSQRMCKIYLQVFQLLLAKHISWLRVPPLARKPPSRLHTWHSSALLTPGVPWLRLEEHTGVLSPCSHGSKTEQFHHAPAASAAGSKK